jgi:hypothetical protein
MILRRNENGERYQCQRLDNHPSFGIVAIFRAIAYVARLHSILTVVALSHPRVSVKVLMFIG